MNIQNFFKNLEKKIPVCLLMISMLFLGLSQSFALTDDIEAFEFWVPEIMLEGNTYEFLIIQKEYNPNDLNLEFSTNNEEIIEILNSQINVDSGKSHGIVKMHAKKAGEAKIFAVIGGEVIEKSLIIQKPALRPAQLDLVLADNSVKIKNMPVYVVLKDAFGSPVQTESDIEINVNAFGGVKSQFDSIIIKEGSHYSALNLLINGEGGITVAASNLDSDTEKIVLERAIDEPELKIRVAPNPLAPASGAEVYVWLEQDDKPFLPKEDIEINLVSSDEDFLTFVSDSRFNRNPTTEMLNVNRTIILESGSSFAKAKIFSTDFISEFNPTFGEDLRIEDLEEDEALEIRITALAEGYEGRQTDVKIQAAQSVNPSFVKDLQIDSSTTKTNFLPDASFTKAWIYPSPVFDEFEIVVAPFVELETDSDEDVVSGGFSDENKQEICNDGEDNDNDGEIDEDDCKNRNESISVDEQGDDEEISNACTDCAPLIIVESDLSAHITTDNLLIPEKNTDTLYSSSFTNKENYVVISGTTKGIPGEANVAAVIDGTEGDTIEVDVEEPFTEDLKLGIQSLPIVLDTPQDLFLIYLTEGGVITDEVIDNLIVRTNPEIEILEIKDAGDIKVVNGIVAKGVTPTGEVTITALASGIEGSIEKIAGYDPKLRNIVVEHPPVVRSNESFPFYVIATDQKDNPIENVDATISPSDSFAEGEGELKKLSSIESTKLVIFKDGMTPTTSQIDVIAHSVKLDITKKTITNKIRKLWQY